MYLFLRDQVSSGRQAYIVCPLVEDTDSDSDLQSAKSLYENLKNNELKGLRIGLTWGAQRPEEKDRTLMDFSKGKYDVLVSTTVIEVGVNNPNATIMIIENAERYGLSQLHQLRGRVGRGDLESWCFLLSDCSEKLKVLGSLNEREIRLCILVLIGNLRDKEMADILCYSNKSIRSIKRIVAKKLGTTSRNLRAEILDIAVY